MSACAERDGQPAAAATSRSPGQPEAHEGRSVERLAAWRLTAWPTKNSATRAAAPPIAAPARLSKSVAWVMVSASSVAPAGS